MQNKLIAIRLGGSYSLDYDFGDLVIALSHREKLGCFLRVRKKLIPFCANRCSPYVARITEYFLDHISHYCLPCVVSLYPVLYPPE